MRASKNITPRVISALFILNNWSNSEFGAADYESLNSEQKAVLRQRLQDTVVIDKDETKTISEDLEKMNIDETDLEPETDDDTFADWVLL